MANKDLVEVIESAGMDVVDRDVSVELEGGTARTVDFVLQDGETSYVAQLTNSSTVQVLLTAPFFRTFTLLEAVRRQEPFQDHSGLMLIVLDEFDERGLKRIQRQFANYAPGYEFLLISSDRSVYASVEDDWDEELVGQMAEPTDRDHLTYSDQELLLTKTLAYATSPNADSNGSSSGFPNTKALVDEVPVSQGKVYQWVRRLKQKGWIEQSSAGLELVNPEEYLERWRRHYQFNENNTLGRYVVEGEQPDWWERLGSLPESFIEQFVVTRYDPKELELKRLSEPVYLFWLGGDESDFVTELGLREATEGEGAEVILKQPKYEQSIIEGAKTHNGIRFADRVQLELDRNNNRK